MMNARVCQLALLTFTFSLSLSVGGCGSPPDEDDAAPEATEETSQALGELCGYIEFRRPLLPPIRRFRGCSTGAYCKPFSTCSGTRWQGVCQAIPRECSRHPSWGPAVTACNGKKYSNSCAAYIAGSSPVP